MSKLMLMIKGFFIGIANIIPGVSGGTLMISLGIFEEIIDAISHFFSNIVKNTKFLFWIGLGGLLSILLVSRLVTYTLDNYKLVTILFFIGLIIGGIPMLSKTVSKGKTKVSNYIILLITFSLIMFMTFYNGGLAEVSLVNLNMLDYVKLFFVGLVAAATMVVPGLSGSFMLILLGYYEPIMNTIKAFTSFENVISNGLILGVFALGVGVGIILVAKLIEFLIEKFKIKTYFAILGFVFASVISIFYTSFVAGFEFTILQVVLSIIFFIIGFMISLKLGD